MKEGPMDISSDGLNPFPAESTHWHCLGRRFTVYAQKSPAYTSRALLRLEGMVLCLAIRFEREYNTLVILWIIMSEVTKCT